MTTNNRSFNLKLNFQVNPGFSIVCVIIIIILISLKLLGVLSVSWLAATALAFALLLGFLALVPVGVYRSGSLQPVS